MSSKLVTRQYDLTALAAGAALENAPVVGAKLNALLAAYNGAEGTPADWQESIDQIGQLLQDAAKTLLQTDEDNERSRTEQIQLRELRDLAAAKVRAELRSLRFLFDELFGKQKSRRLFPARGKLSNATPKMLLRQAKELSELLRSDRIHWPAEPMGRHLVPPAELAASLEASSLELEAPLEGLRPKLRGSDVRRDLKNAELERAASLMRRGTDLLYGVYRLAGFDEAAANLRPTRIRRRVRVSQMPGEAMAPQSTPQSASPAAGAMEVAS